MRDSLRKRVEDSPLERKGVVLAALNNSHNPDNLDVNLQYINSKDEYLAEQAVYGLSNMDSDVAFQALRNVISIETRERVLHRAIAAMSGYVEQEVVIQDLTQLAERMSEKNIYISVINVLAGSKNTLAWDFVETLSANSQKDESIREHAQQALRTMKSPA